MQRKHNIDIVTTAKMLRKVLGNDIADFYCAEAKLVMEIDGSGHYTDEAKEYNEKRTAFLKNMD